MVLDAFIKVFVPAIVAFCAGIAMTPFWTHFLYTYKMWKPKAGKIALGGGEASVFNELHKEKEVGTPRMGGVIIWASVLFTVMLFWALQFTDIGNIDFLSRSQTWIPVGVLLIGALVGFADDALEIRGAKSGTKNGGLSLRKRLAVVAVLGIAVAYWFYTKVGITTVGIPFDGTLFVGWGIIPLFTLILLAIYAGGVIDGIDGLSGGVFASAFAAYGGIAFFQQQYDIAALCTTIVGGILAFLWFNIPPARFYMTETGSMALTLCLGVIALMTDTPGEGIGLAVLPIIAFPLVITVCSVLLQVFWKKVFKKKLFRVAPIHHHFEALGWPAYKVTMRYWIIGVVMAITGMIVAFIG